MGARVKVVQENEDKESRRRDEAVLGWLWVVFVYFVWMFFAGLKRRGFGVAFRWPLGCFSTI